ncbi:hypothetical protein F2Q70_00029286 [Brassica cretica]|uniref:Uncharacterized protein n=1 Tax=Brassica cretica TaxID=69181 RepID=A0A8S9FDB7_BRACR|nr:hypothetical protein F2Q70_00029286 [Brassica cretica]KAF3594642.1 hypothetical protein DY000_02020675 [Brassica cretica]
MTLSFLERIGQPEVDLAKDREESDPFNVDDATSILEFSSSHIFSMLFRDSLGTTETERNALVLEDFSHKFLNETSFIKPERASRLWLIVEFMFDIGTAFRNSQGRSRDAKDDQEDSPGDEVLATDQGVRGRMVRPWRQADGRILILGFRSISFLYPRFFFCDRC